MLLPNKAVMLPTRAGLDNDCAFNELGGHGLIEAPVRNVRYWDGPVSAKVN